MGGRARAEPRAGGKGTQQDTGRSLGGVGSNVSWTPALEEPGPNVLGESPPVPGKAESSGQAGASVPRLRALEPGVLGDVDPRLCAGSCSLTRSPRKYPPPLRVCGQVGVGLPRTLGGRGREGMSGLGNRFPGEGSWGAAG